MLLTTQFYYGQACHFQWAKSIGDSNDEAGVAICTDTHGNVYSGTVGFNPGASAFNLTSSGKGIFISKLDAAGNFVWTKNIAGDTYDEKIVSMKTDGSGNICIAGYFSGIVDFDPGSGTNTITTSNNYECFVLKLDASGSFVWVKNFGSQGSAVFPSSLNIDEQSNIYISGRFSGTPDFDPGAGTTTITTSSSYFSPFAAKLNASGNVLWAKGLDGAEDAKVLSSAIDLNGNFCLAGKYTGTYDFDPGPTTYTLNNGLYPRMFVMELDASGNFIWAKSFAGDEANPNAMICDIGGNFCVAGDFYGTIDFNPGAATFTMAANTGQSVFIMKLDHSGNFVWARSHTGPNGQTAYGIAGDNSGNIYTTGYFIKTVNFAPQGSSYTLTTTNGSSDVFISKLDIAGNLLWVQSFGGAIDDQAKAITVDATGNVYTTGYFSGTSDFDEGTGVSNIISSGGLDCFVHKMSQGVTGIKQNIITDAFSACPNPTKDKLTVVGLSLKAKLYLINTLGEIIYSGDCTSSSLELNLENYTSGVYYLIIQREDGQKTVKIIRE